MKIWFARSNGSTVHNNPMTPGFVTGEPPIHPATIFNYRAVCLREGFARIGWPSAGDLRKRGWREKGRAVYSSPEFKDVHESYLEKLASIQTGDVVVIPADREEHDVHIGTVVLRLAPDRQVTCVRPGLAAYYYRYNVPSGNWFENAHRVDVLWDRDGQGEFGVHTVPELGGVWRRAFGSIVEGERRVLELAGQLGLIRSGG